MPVVPQFLGIEWVLPLSNAWSMNRAFQSAFTKSGSFA